MSEETMEAVVAEQETAVPTSINDLKPKMKLTGEVKRLELYGAFIDLGIDVNALIHISQLGKENVNRVADVLNVGDKVEVWVDKVDPERKQVTVTMIEPLAVEWTDLKKGMELTGTITRLETFGAFVNIGAEREGLVHISEMSHDYVKHPSEVAQVGDEVKVQVLNFSKRKRRIDLSMKALMEKPESQVESYSRNKVEYEPVEEEDEDLPTAMELALRRALQGADDDNELVLTVKKGKTNKKKKKNKRLSKQQEELLNRTLMRQNN
ncbi:MAG: S1 RNA-binding domain-containing protein [Candidatus Thermofonsia bacterium]|nr:MAG: S1 RNA-binding domain-containing protein [Candidatus Thermofonsia bacterium]